MSTDHRDGRSAYPNAGGYDAEDLITLRAKKFLEMHEKHVSNPVREKAAGILAKLKDLASAIKTSFSEKEGIGGEALFARLASFFVGDALESITSYELLSSGIVHVLLEVLNRPQADGGRDARSIFLQTFLSEGTLLSTGHNSATTPFAVLVGKLQDLFSRAEHFEVITVHQHSYESNRSSASSMLGKQLRLKLVADDDSGVPKTFRHMMVSIHAISTFKSLDDYLRPRITLTERIRPPRSAASHGASAGGAEARTSSGSPSLQPPSEITNRAAPRKSTRQKGSTAASTSQAGPSSTVEPASRRSSKRQQPQSQPQPPPAPPALPLPRSHSSQEPIECADEERLSDSETMAEGMLNAIVDGLEDEIESTSPDPSAVNVEVGSAGGVTARKDTGLRASTPAQSQSPRHPSGDRRVVGIEQHLASILRGSSLQRALGTSSGSYAAAMQSIPQDFHIQFSINDQVLSNSTTIYRAVHFSQAQPGDVSSRTLWNALHTIKFRKVSGPPPDGLGSFPSRMEESSKTATGLPASLDKNPTTSAILRLLSILHGLPSNMDAVFSGGPEPMKLHVEPLSQFVNTKLTAKMNRQLEEPLIVGSNCLPTWTADLTRLYPFLFPFETRHLYVKSTSFGHARAITRWVSQPPSGGRRDTLHLMVRVPRQKIRVARARIFESACRVLETFGDSASQLEIEYFDEEGTGLGPTLEFFATVSNDFSHKRHGMWRTEDAGTGREYAGDKGGLFPAPMSAAEAETDRGKKVLHNFELLGKFVARSMLDDRTIDLAFNPAFFRLGNGNAPVSPSLGALHLVDAALAKHLKMLKRYASAKQSILERDDLNAAEKVRAKQGIQVDGARMEDLTLYFNLPGYSIELVENGDDRAVTVDNVDDYVDRVVDLTLGPGVQRQLDAFRAGFSRVFPYADLQAFTPDELIMLFGRAEEDWSLETLSDSIKADHGYNMDSRSVGNLLLFMSNLSIAERRAFLQFVSGSPRLPIGGFKALTPMFTVVCKGSDPGYTSDDYLPSVMTCVNYLKMPDYTSVDVLREKFGVAMREGQGAFHLS